MSIHLTKIHKINTNSLQITEKIDGVNHRKKTRKFSFRDSYLDVTALAMTDHLIGLKTFSLIKEVQADSSASFFFFSCNRCF